MKEIIFSAPNVEILKSEATRLGFADSEGNIITNGSFESGGSWFLNIVGTIYEPVAAPENPDDPWTEPVAREGYWGRLRINGEPESFPTFNSSIVQYVYDNDLDGWTSDGINIAEDFVSTIGVIA